MDSPVEDCKLHIYILASPSSTATIGSPVPESSRT